MKRYKRLLPLAMIIALVTTLFIPAPAPVAAGVPSPTVTLSNYRPAVPGVTYTVRFTIDVSLAISDTIDVLFPATTNITGVGATDALINSTRCSTVTKSGTTVTVTIPLDIPSYSNITVEIENVRNPYVGSYQLRVGTSKSGWVASEPYNIVQYVSSVRPVDLSNNTAGASGVTYTVRFSSDFDLTTDAADNITVAFPAGTDISRVGATDVLINSMPCSAITKSGTSITATVPLDTLWGSFYNYVTVTIGNMSNPGVGAYQLWVKTTQEPGFVLSPTYYIGGVGSATVELSNSTPGAISVTYVLRFTTAVSLTAAAGDNIIVEFPVGTNIASVAGANVLVNATPCSGIYKSGTTLTIYPATNVPAGNIVVTIPGMGNPGAGARQLRVKTTKENAFVASQTYNIVVGVSSITVDLSNSAPGASNITYTLRFTTTVSLIAAVDTITIAFPTGTDITRIGAADVLINAMPCATIIKSGTILTATVPNRCPRW